MKKLFLIALSFLFIYSMLSISVAKTNSELTGSPVKNNTAKRFNSKYELIEANYLLGLNSGNRGIEDDCAYFLGEMKSDKAVLPLMKIFKETNSEGTKLLVAWSLLKIGNSYGINLVKQEFEKGNSESINSMLEWLYNDYLLKTKGKIF